MEDVRSIIAGHTSKKSTQTSRASKEPQIKVATTSEIPDLFFDEILVDYKLSRIDIQVLMFLYRQVWCRPNLFREFGIGPVQTYIDISSSLNLTIDDLQQSLRILEACQFVETIRAGQYFVRKYFTQENDALYGQHYNDFA